MELNADFKSYQDRITSSLVNVTRTAGQISSQDLGFHRSSSDKFSHSLDAQCTHLLRLTNRLLKAASKDTSVKVPTLQNRDDIEDTWHNIVDVVDDLLEKADRSLDEFTGVIRRLSPSRQDGSEASSRNLRQTTGSSPWLQRNLPKPQLLFERKVNNYDTEPWRPLLSTKPHANMPLEDSIGTGQEGFKHPYAHEIQHMIYPTFVYQMSPPVPYSPPEESQPIFVDTEEAVLDMLDELRLAKEIAIDLEHNDKNSYIGLVCLMQISTRTKDWIVDTLKPWRENLQMLNEVFANPRIIKVLHGSTSDIIWLQRDLGLYVVGLFDTYHASSALQFPSKSLKYLLERFANFEAQKQYQLADWRVRPLPQELIDYARSDTHFLLYIYDELRNMLLEASTPRENLIERVLDASRREALQVYEKPVYDKEQGLNQNGWMRMLLQRSAQLSNEQLGVFRAIHEWRDNKAREFDEGDQTIMPNSWIWTIAEILPTHRGAFHQRGHGTVPVHVNKNIPEIIEVVKQGMTEGKNGPTLPELIEKHGSKAGYMFGRNKYIRKKVEEPNRGVGATLQMLNNSGEVSTTPAATNVTTTSFDEPIATKTATSQLWGPIASMESMTNANMTVIAQALESVLPLQVLQQYTFSVSDYNGQPTAQSAPAKHQLNGVSQMSATKEDEIFTIKDHNKKRKASEALSVDEQPTAISESDFRFDDFPTAENGTLTKHQVKQARKAEKKAKKANEARIRAAAEANMVPFDYANAESMLHAKPEVLNGDAADKKAKDKPLNPFVRALDTSTGARRNRMGKELAGKSHTFKG